MKKVTTLFSTNLFWDTDDTSLDLEQHSRFIIGRVLMRGHLQDWIMLNRCYTKEQIKTEVINTRYLDKLTLHFCSVFFHIPKSDFRCYKQTPSIQKLWPY